MTCKTLFFVDFSAEEGPNNGGSIARRQCYAMHKTCRCIAIAASANRTLEGGVEHAGFDDVFTGGTPQLRQQIVFTPTMHLAILDTINL